MSDETPYEKDQMIRAMCDDWAENHTHLQDLCREVGYGDFDVEGDGHGIRGIMELSDMLRVKAIPDEAIFAKELANALWEKSILRHGMFTPPQFAALCEAAIVDFLAKRKSV